MLLRFVNIIYFLKIVTTDRKIKAKYYKINNYFLIIEGLYAVKVLLKANSFFDLLLTWLTVIARVGSSQLTLKFV